MICYYIQVMAYHWLVATILKLLNKIQKYIKIHFMDIRIVTYILYYYKYLTTNDDKREKNYNNLNNNNDWQ